jgi:hypothetical protein
MTSPIHRVAPERASSESVWSRQALPDPKRSGISASTARRLLA